MPAPEGDTTKWGKCGEWVTWTLVCAAEARLTGQTTCQAGPGPGGGAAVIAGRQF